MQILLNCTRSDENVLSSPQTVKHYISHYKEKKEIFYLNVRHDTMNIESPNNNFFTNNLIVDTFAFITTIILAIATIIIQYLLWKHNKLRTLVASLALQQVKEVGTLAMKHDTNNACNCTPKFYIILALSASLFRLVLFTFLQARRIKLCR